MKSIMNMNAAAKINVGGGQETRNVEDVRISINNLAMSSVKPISKVLMILHHGGLITVTCIYFFLCSYILQKSHPKVYVE